MCWLQPDYSVAVLAKRPNHLVGNPSQRPMRTENPGESSIVIWLSGIILCLTREKCACGQVSMRPRNSFTVGHVWAEGQQGGNIDGSRVLELLQERCISVFRRTHTLRADPDGAWRNRGVHQRLSDMQIVLDLHQGEASWQASVTENSVGIAKDTMTRIALERSGLTSTEVLAAAVLTHNEMERVGGFSPAQYFRQ